jgi:dTDP-4-amino-4,6-dideoxygalactose transaminase
VISYYRPYFNWAEILAILRPGTGRREFEAAVADCVGACYGLAFAYGRSSVVALFKALGLSQAEIVMPAFTCSVMAEAVAGSGNRPVFVDIDPTNYNMDIEAIKAALTSKTRAVIATHMHGYPADVDEIRQVVGDERVLIVEDAALALRPATSDRGGISGDVAFYSFGRGKQLYTITGGVMVTDSPNLYEKLKAYRDREMNRLPTSAWMRRHLQVLTAYMALSGSLEERVMWLKSIGMVNRTRKAVGLVRDDLPQDYATAYADFQGRIGLAQLRKLDAALARARSIAEFYNRELQHIPGLTVAPMIPGSTYASYTVRVEQRDRIDFRRRMLDQGVEVGTNFRYTLPQLDAYRAYADGLCPRAEQAAREVVNLPCYPGLSRVEAQRVVECTRSTLQECCA